MLSSYVHKVDFVPVARPPHKKNASLLPFEMRAELVRLSLDGISCLECNVIEERLPGTSYSEQTIRTIATANPDEELFFLLGSSDYALLPEWRNGLKLPEICNLVVAPRGDMNFNEFVELTKSLWPERSISLGEQEFAACESGEESAKELWLNGCGRIFYLPVPWLQISSTYIRKLWLCGDNIDFLLPSAALNLLNRERHAVEVCWRRTIDA